MRKAIAKYFWGLNEKALRETEQILSDPVHPRFTERLVTLLSRCDKPKEIFSFLSKEEFISAWPNLSRYWKKITPKSDFREWWQAIYEQIAREYGKKQKPKGALPLSFSKIGVMIRQKRVKEGISQSELALKTGMKQPDISNIEEGKKNITLRTLVLLCRVLGIKNIELE